MLFPCFQILLEILLNTLIEFSKMIFRFAQNFFLKILPSSSSSIYLEPGVDPYLMYRLAWEQKVPNIKGTGRWRIIYPTNHSCRKLYWGWLPYTIIKNNPVNRQKVFESEKTTRSVCRWLRQRLTFESFAGWRICKRKNNPIGFMYGISTYICLIFVVNVGKYNMDARGNG